MNYIGIDTSGKPLTIVMKYGKKEYAYEDAECGTQHSVALMGAVSDLLTRANARLSDFDFFACVTGAGSFTGIRIGVSTVKAFCFAEKKPCLPITSFDVLAYDVPDGSALCVVDARHGSYYAQIYNGFRPSGDPMFIGTEEYERLAAVYPVAAAGDVPHLKYRCDLCAGFRAAVEGKTAEVTADLDRLTPLYIRKSQAEEGR